MRQSKKISQERLALEGGFDRTYISLIERGINSPTIRVVVGLAGVLKVPAWRIVLMAASEGSIFAGPVGATPPMPGGGEWPNHSPA